MLLFLLHYAISSKFFSGTSSQSSRSGECSNPQRDYLQPLESTLKWRKLGNRDHPKVPGTRRLKISGLCNTFRNQSPEIRFSLESQRMMIRLDFEFPANRMMLDCWAFGPSTARGNIEKKGGTFPFDPENASILTIQKPITTIAVWPQIPLYLGAFIFLLPHTVNISFSRHGLRVKGHLSACPHDL